MKYIIEKPKRVALPIQDCDALFPVGRIYCVGRNYAAHSREMGDDPDRDPPFFFCKDATCVLSVPFDQQTDLVYPAGTSQFEYEVELVVALGKGGSKLTPEQAKGSILGYSVGLDMTRRDLQATAKKQGRPWEVGKSFDCSAPLSPIQLATDELNKKVAQSQISLRVNGDIKQTSHITHLTWSIEEVISKLSEVFELRPGDLIMTGTPENVGPALVGDKLVASIEALGEINLKVID